MYRSKIQSLFSIVAINIIIICSCTNASNNKETPADTSVVINNNEDSKESIASDALLNNASEMENTPETECNSNKRAYEFGREMATMVKLGSSSLASAIREYAESMSIEEPFKSSDPCVKKGFDDENNGIPSPYNKEERNWTSF